MNLFIANAETASRPFLLAPRDRAHSRRLGDTAVFARSKEPLRLRLHATVFLVDLLAITLAFLAAGAVRFGALEEQTLRTLGIVIPTFLAIAFNNRAYSIATLQRPPLGAAKSVEALFYAIAVAIGLLFSLKVSSEFSRAVFAAGTLLSIAAVFGARSVAGHYLGRKHRWTFTNNLMIVDTLPWDYAEGQPAVSAERLGLDVSTDDPVMLHRLNQLLEHCDRVVVACPPDHRRAWSDALKSTAIDVEILMPELTPLGATAMSTERGQTTLLVSSGPLSLHDRAIKRAFDLVIAGVALVLLAPLMLLLALAIRLDSRGPVLFRQQRFGQNNRMFGLLKFRSMRVECSDAVGTCSTSQVDGRMTRIGAFIRRTSLDELPQFLNVIGGTMSIVGPRPHAVGSTAEDALFWHIDRRYFDRHAIKPGITGLAQIRGFRGATRQRDDLTNRLQADLEYVSGWTVWRDFRIIFATFGVLIHENAY